MAARLELKELVGHRMLLHVELREETTLEWTERMKASIDDILNSNGALLVRGLRIESATKFGEVLSGLFDQPLSDYVYRSTPRTKLSGNIFTATEYPSSEAIPQHNENAYTDQWPMRIGFYALWPSKSGGQTPLADSRKIFQRLPSSLVDRFAKHGILYVRNYGQLDLPWDEVFQTKDRSVVESYCSTHGLKFEWLEDNGLRTWQINPAIQRHPVSGELLWFNQAHLFHISNLGDELAEAAISEFGEDKLPRNAYFGDGSPIPQEDLTAIRSAIDSEKFCFPWQRGDLLLLDNMHFTHGREPFEGPRKILVGMAHSRSLKDIGFEAFDKVSA